MNEIEYLAGDEQDEEKTDRELSEEELKAVAGGKASAEGMIAANAEANLDANADSLVERDAERDSESAALRDSDKLAG
jgi:hypothetical protein